MNLYLISQDENNDWDTYDSAVVCAPDEETARNIVPGCVDGNHDWADRYSSWCSGPDKVKVEPIGYAADGIPIGVVCASFNAG